MTESEFNRLYEETSGKVLSGIMRIVQHEAVAEELVQETFLQFLRTAEKETVQSVKGLLFRISHNLAVDFVRRDRRTANQAEADAVLKNQTTESESEYRILRAAIVERIRREDECLLRFYILTVDYGLHIDEIAAELGVSRRSAFRLRDQLKSILAEFL
ncbi:MAG: RNA polymerase sigma factor [Turneriella sp.]